MKFSQTGEYAIRAMSQLALLGPGECAPAADLAEATKIPPQYLSKVMRRLVVAKLVLSKRGHHGGFTLARAPKDITMMKILQAVDHDFGSTHCAFGWPKCDDKKPCPVHHIWQDARERLSEWATSHTLEDVRSQSD